VADSLSGGHSDHQFAVPVAVFVIFAVSRHRFTLSVAADDRKNYLFTFVARG